MSVVRFIPTHVVIANSPAIISVAADDPVCCQRLFIGDGAPTSLTLAAGNGRYCATTSGFVVGASLVDGGSGNQVGDVFTFGSGTATIQLQVTVDSVSATGAVITFHVSRCGVYTTYPASPITIAGPNGTAQFNLAIQPADAYLDKTAKALYVCTTAGTNAMSNWAQISGGSGFCGEYDPSRTYSAGQIVIISMGASAGAYAYINATPSSGNAPNVGGGWWAQFPMGPSGMWL
jgi:hypothetical protein